MQNVECSRRRAIAALCRAATQAPPEAAMPRREAEMQNVQKENSVPLAYSAVVKPLATKAGCLCASVPSSKSGFSLIEVLVAMAVMTVIIVMVTNMFRDASEAWDIGTQRAEMNTSARAAMEYIARELSYAVAGSIPDSQGATVIVKPFTLLTANSDLSFSALSGENRALRGVLFRFDSNNHIIETEHNNNSPYGATAWTWPTAALLITNVWRFGITVCSNESDMMNGGGGYAYDSSVNSNLLPACVDISIEMLGERDMTRALSLPDVPAGSSPREGYVMTNSRVYTTRVCFPNRGAR